MREIIKKIPIFGTLAIWFKGAFIKKNDFTTSSKYWETRYKKGGNSGEGSYKKLAKFKSEVINKFVTENSIDSVIEFGSGDGNQLTLFKFKQYLGVDVSKTAIDQCKEMYLGDESKSFVELKDFKGHTSQLTMSLDVIYHLIEDEVYFSYLELLFKSAEKYVIIYSSNQVEQKQKNISHIKHRKFTDWIDMNMPNFKLISEVPNIYKGDGLNGESSFADFYIYEKKQ